MHVQGLGAAESGRALWKVFQLLCSRVISGGRLMYPQPAGLVLPPLVGASRWAWPAAGAEAAEQSLSNMPCGQAERRRWQQGAFIGPENLSPPIFITHQASTLAGPTVSRAAPGVQSSGS